MDTVADWLSRDDGAVVQFTDPLYLVVAKELAGPKVVGLNIKHTPSLTVLS